MKVVQKQFYEKPSFYIKLVILFIIVYFCSRNDVLLPRVLAIFVVIFTIRSEWQYYKDGIRVDEILDLKDEIRKGQDLTTLYQEELLTAYKVREEWNNKIYDIFYNKDDIIKYNYGVKMGELFAFTFICSPEKKLIRYYEYYLKSIKDKKIISYVKDIISQLNKLHEKGMNDLTLSDAIMIKTYVDLTMKYNNENLLYEGIGLRMYGETLGKQIVYIAKKVYKIKIDEEEKITYLWQSEWVDTHVK